MALVKGKSIHDRRPQHGVEWRYTVPKGIRPPSMKSAHENVAQALPVSLHKNYDSRQIKELVLEYMRTPEIGKDEWLGKLPTLPLPTQSQSPAPITAPVAESLPARAASLRGLLSAYAQQYSSTWGRDATLHNNLAQRSWEAFFDAHGIETTDQLADGTIQDFVNWRHKRRLGADRRSGDVSQKTLTIETRYFREVLDLAECRGQVGKTSLMFKKLAIPKTKTTVNPYDIKEIEALLKFTRDTKAEWAEHMILFILNTGMRASEVDRMTQADWHMKEGLLTVGNPEMVSGNTEGKTMNSDRYVEITPVMRKLYASGLIFEKLQGPCRDRLGTFLRRKRVEKIAVQDPAIHRIRHTFASWMYRSGLKSLEEISESLGHADLAFTKRQYAKKGMERANRDQLRQKYKDALQFYLERYEPS